MEAYVFQGFARLARERAGMTLQSDARYLLKRRLRPRLEHMGFFDEASYLAYLLSPEGAREIEQFLDAVSTGFTQFFREPEHFERAVEEARKALAEGQNRFRYWSAACSSGEEAFSLAMSLDAVFSMRSVDWRILATDLSSELLRVAQNASYPEGECEVIPEYLRTKYLVRDGANERLLKIENALKTHVTFRKLNLASADYPMNGPLDAIFCRNVLFYLADEVRQSFVIEAERLLKPGGLLFLGESETLHGLKTSLTPLCPFVLKKAHSQRGAA